MQYFSFIASASYTSGAFLRICLLALLCVTSVNSIGQTAADGSVAVINQPNSTKPLIVSATRTPTKGADVLADYVYIGPEEIAQAGQMSVPELLQQQRGVQISTYGGPGGLASVYLRGTSNNQSLVLIDGVRTESSTLGGAVWSAIPIQLIDHIEIIFGPQSTFYGQDALGGVIQIFTKRGDGPAQFSASSGYGTYGTTINTASVSGSVGEDKPTRYNLGLSQENSMGFNTVASTNPCSAANASKNYCAPGYPTTRTGYTRLGVTGQVSHEWKKGQEFGVKVLASRTNYQYPGYDYDASLPEINSQVNNLSIATVFARNQITENWESFIQLSNTSNFGQNLTTNSNESISSPQNDFLWKNDIKVGPDTLQVMVERLVQYANTTNINASRTTNSAAGSYQLNRGNNLATLAVRNDTITGYGPIFTYSGAYGYFLTKALRANVNYGTGFRAPTFNDLYYPGYGTPNVQPETNRNAEAGLHYEPGNYELHLVGYQNKVQNLIQALPCTSKASGYCPTNFASVNITGASLGANTQLEHWNLKASLDLLNAVDQNTGLALPNRAKQLANLGSEYRRGKFNAGANLTIAGQRYGNASNTVTMSSYALLDLYASYEIQPKWSLFARWNNALNNQYQLSYGYLTPGSNIFAGVRYTP